VWPSHACYNCEVARAITQRTLRNESGEIMRGLDRGESFVVTRNGVPVGELTPMRRRRFVAAEAVLSVLAGAPRLDPKRFREDVDRVIDQDARPRA
jgi:antitoxin (DNA-binding transcriptional repressor) of toxin-antitoxin stability system